MESPVMVQNISSIPVRVQHTPNMSVEPDPMEVDNSGFTSDNDAFKSHLDDIARRHPEFAQHFNRDFPFRSNTWGHKRRGSGNKEDENIFSSAREDFPELKRFTDRPFGSRFERFGYPFNRPSFDSDPHFRQEFDHHSQPQQPQSSNQQQAQSSSRQSPQPSTSSKDSQADVKPQEHSEKPPQVPTQDRGRKQHPYIAQSNTADLGQRQEAVNEPRGQRSMSAPPENRSNQQRYVSSINIPINVERGGGGGDMGSQQSQQQQQNPQPQQNTQSQNQSSHERVIPIHVEGRDEPVIPRNVHSTFSPPRPEPERVFTGQRPSQFAGWHRNEPPFYRGEPHFQQHPSYQQQQKQKPAFEEPFVQQQQQPQQQEPSQENQLSTTPPPPKQEQQQQAPPKQQQTPIDQIDAIQKDVANLMTQIENFNGKSKDKQYLYLDEMLTRNLIKLDNIQTDGQDNVRQMRKEAIRSIQRCISVLESKATSDKKEQSMDVEQKEEAKAEDQQTMEVEKAKNEQQEQQQEKEPEKVNAESQPKGEEQKPAEEEAEQNSSQQGSEDAQKPDLVALEVSGLVRSGTEVKATENKETASMDVAPESNQAADATKEGEQTAEAKKGDEATEPSKKDEEKKPESGDAKQDQKEEPPKEKKDDKKEKKKVKKKEKTEKK